MAILRTELQGRAAVMHRKNENGSLSAAAVGIFDAIAESETDLSAEQTESFAPGSMIYCLAQNSLHIKTTSGLWEEVSL